MRLVALDVGEKRIGVATADTSVKIAVPYGTIVVDGNEFSAIAKILQDESSHHLVVGLPRNSQGLETEQSRSVRAFVAKFQAYLTAQGIEKPLVRFQDESLTSVQAEQNLSLRSKKRHIEKGEIDREAATLILQDFLDSFSTQDLNVAPSTTSSNEDNNAKKNSKSSKRGLAFKIVALIFAVLILTAVATIAWYYDATLPLNPANCQSENSDCKTIKFAISEGQSTAQIAENLEHAGIIKSSLAFRINLWLEHRGATLKAGNYVLNSGMNLARIVQLLEGGGSAETFSLTFIPGETLVGAKNRLLAIGYPESEIDAAFAADYSQTIFDSKPEGASLEGYIYGDTYEFYANASVVDILNRVFDELQSVVEANQLVDLYAQHNLSFYEGLTLASVIQREAYSADMPQVAQVFLSRLKRNIPLGSDVVIAYRANQINPNRDPSDLSYLQTITCPWNSRSCTGLPPQPISNPGIDALLAVANPAEGEYLYFLTGDDGKMYYAYTEDEHNNNIRLYCKELCKIL